VGVGVLRLGARLRLGALHHLLEEGDLRRSFGSTPLA
jgi:hypothetical protein